MTESTIVRPPVGGWAKWAAIAGWAGIAAVAFAVFDRLGRGRTFFFDEWNFVLDRSHLSVETLLAPHNGHLSLVPAGIYLSLFHTVGLDHYRVFRWVGTGAHIAVATLLVVHVARRRTPLTALSVGAMFLFLGAGWQNSLWPFQIGFMGSLVGLLAALLLLGPKSRPSDLLASSCLAVALACSGV